MWSSLVHPLPGTWPATQVCALTGNQTGDPWVHRPAVNPLSHTSQGMVLTSSFHAMIFEETPSFSQSNLLTVPVAVDVQAIVCHTMLYFSLLDHPIIF